MELLDNYNVKTVVKMLICNQRPYVCMPNADRDWTHMTQEQRRTWLIENAIDIQDEDLHSVSGKDWNQLLPTVKWKLENSTESVLNQIEAQTYKDLCR